MKSGLVVRTRASLLADLGIVLLGTWGFLLQCARSLGLTRGQADELESGD